MRRVHLLLYGLGEVPADLPALAALMRRGRATPDPAAQRAASPGERLAHLFAPSPGGCAALAPARMALDGLAAGEDDWLCADPVHLRLMRDHLLLGDSHVFELGADEAADLVAGLNRHFAERIVFVQGAPERWYARVPAGDGFPPQPPLDACLARPLPAPQAGAPGAVLLTEIQMFLHAHAVNAAREARAADPVNSVWLWGGGDAGRPRAPAPCIVCDGPLCSALATAAGVTPAPPEAFAALLDAPGGDLFVSVERLHAPARYGQTEALATQLAGLEAQLFAPLLDALRRGRIGRLELELPERPNGLRVVSRWDSWKFWRC
jgi:hypothetical protein